jgi:hypothetical protein
MAKRRLDGLTFITSLSVPEPLETSLMCFTRKNSLGVHSEAACETMLCGQISGPRDVGNEVPCCGANLAPLVNPFGLGTHRAFMRRNFLPLVSKAPAFLVGRS